MDGQKDYGTAWLLTGLVIGAILGGFLVYLWALSNPASLT
jgi:hypothetical protein